MSNSIHINANKIRPANAMYHQIQNIKQKKVTKQDKFVSLEHLPSSSGVSSDMSSEENFPPHSAKDRLRSERALAAKVLKVLTNPPPKPARQFLTSYQEGEALYAVNMTYEQMEKTERTLQKVKI